MSWLFNLHKTYQANEEYVGKIEVNGNRHYTLLPISHTTQTAHIEVNVTEDGSFNTASIISNDANTVIPCTETSASRSGISATSKMPYPLHDKLFYVAGDFVDYCDEAKYKDSFQNYISNLGNWARSPFATGKVKSIWSYLRKGTLIADLVKENIVFLDEKGKLITKWDKKYEGKYGAKPEIFSAVTGGVEAAFVRFNVVNATGTTTKVWEDLDVYHSFIDYYNELLGEEDICYVTGEKLPTTDLHANKIRNSGDKTKLISANDKSGFTFRGRFKESREAAKISYEVSQKAHNALKWLINRQGTIIDQRVFLIWSPQNEVLLEAYDIFDSTPIVLKGPNEVFAREIAKALAGYRSNLSTKSKVNILILDAATPGRLAALYYREINQEQYFNQLEDWFTSCIWSHHYKTGEGILVPPLKEIAIAAYGSRNEKLIKETVSRLVPCVIEKDRKIPKDITRSAFHHATRPLSFQNKWEWEKTLSITCAIINREERYDVGLQQGNEVRLDENNKDRDYLFGRLLAIADVLEKRVLGPDENRETNAIRYMSAFVNHPERTWKTIQLSIQPYQVRLAKDERRKKQGEYFAKLIDEVLSQISYEEFNNEPLSGKFLLGFSCQRHELYRKKEKKEGNGAEQTIEKENENVNIKS